LRTRVENKDKEEELFGGDADDQALSYLEGDLPFSWRKPKYFKSLHFEESGECGEKYKTIDEAVQVDPDEDSNEVFVFSCFNLIDNKEFYDNYKKRWRIANSTDLENAINCTCILADIKTVFLDQKRLLNVEDKIKTVKGTEQGVYSITNLAHEGIVVDDKNKIKAGEEQDLAFNDLIEWYFCYYDNDIDGHQLILQKKDKFVVNKKWLNEYERCLPKEYRGFRRLKLMYRRYDPSRETYLEKEYALKINFLYTLLSSMPDSSTIELEEDRNLHKLNFINNFFFTLENKTKKYINFRYLIKLYDRIYEKSIEKKVIKKKYKKYKEEQGELKKKLTKEEYQTEGSNIKINEWLKYLRKYSGSTALFNIFEKLSKTTKFSDKINEFDTSIMGIIKEESFIFFEILKTILKELLCEYKAKLHHLRRKIFARVIKGGEYKGLAWIFLLFKEGWA
jgi:hypothetical protein